MALQPSQMSVREIMEMVFANKWLFLVCVAAGFIFAYIWAERKPKDFQAYATVQIENPMSGDPLTSEVGKSVERMVDATSGAEHQFAEVKTQVMSTENLEAIARSLQLPQYGSDYDRAAASIRANTSISLRKNMIYVTCTRRKDKDGLVDAPQAAKQAAEIANAVAESIVAKHKYVRDDLNKQALDWLESKRNKYARLLKQAQIELETYDTLRNLDQSELDPRQILADINRVQLHDVNSEALIGRYQDALKQYLSNKVRLEGLLAKYEELERQIAQEPEQIVKITSQRSETHEELSKRYAEALAELASLRRTRSDQHWEVQDQMLEVEELKTQLETVKKPVVQQESFEANPVVEQLKIQQSNLSADIAEIQTQQSQIEMEKKNLVSAIEKILDEGTEREQLKQKVAIQTDVYNDFMERYAEAEVAADLAKDNERAMRFVLRSRAGAPSKPVGYNAPFMWLMGIFVGAVIGAILCLAREITDTSFRNLDDASRYLDMPVLGVIPEVPGTPRRRRIRSGQKKVTAQ